MLPALSIDTPALFSDNRPKGGKVNRMTNRVLLALLLLLAVASLRCPSKATVAGRPDMPEPDFIVAADGSTDYEEIGDALADAEDGDVILVKPGTYEEEVEFDSDLSDITLIGSGPDQTIIDADGEYAAVTLRGSGHRITGFTLRGAESHGVYIPDGKHKVDYCLIVENGDRGIYLSTMSGRGRAKIDHCTIADNDVSGIYSVDDDDETEISNSIVAFNGRGIVTDEEEGGIEITYSCFSNEGENFDRVSEGETNITDDPQFRDHGDGDYRLEKDSPCVKAASDGSNMGCF
jgi:hypothetical protein